jgi:hypothetical protein
MEKTFVSFSLHTRMDMFDRIETAIVSVLQDQLKTVPPENIHAKRRQPRGSLPILSIFNVDFDVKEVGFGRSIGGVELLDTFSGDATTVKFLLSIKPLRPIVAVEEPPETRLTEGDYTVNYEKGLITFNKPPPAATDNIVVRYIKPTQVKSLKLDLRYHLNVWAGDEVQRDAITVEVMEVLLREEEALNRQDIFIKPIKGFNIPPNDDISEEVYGKTIEYSIEASLEVEIALPRMEKIEIHPARVLEKPIIPKDKQTKKYVVYVDDNFHYKDEKERYKLGEFASCKEAIETCKEIVDKFLERGYGKGVSYKELYEGYTAFGEDPFIISDDESCRFSAWDYAKKRCRELCG